jgi:hypothetical protein
MLKVGKTAPQILVNPHKFEQFGNSRPYCNATVIRYVIAPTKSVQERHTLLLKSMHDANAEAQAQFFRISSAQLKIFM